MPRYQTCEGCGHDTWEEGDDLYTKSGVGPLCETCYGNISYIENLERKNEALQARIDELMLEFCPDAMTAEQLKRLEPGRSAIMEI